MIPTTAVGNFFLDPAVFDLLGVIGQDFAKQFSVQREQLFDPNQSDILYLLLFSVGEQVVVDLATAQQDPATTLGRKRIWNDFLETAGTELFNR